MQTIFPILRYNDARAAIRWLCSPLGLVQVLSVPEAGDYVRHAQLKLGKNLIMVGSVRPNDGIVSPRGAGLGTNILCSLANSDFRSWEYHVLDRGTSLDV